MRGEGRSIEDTSHAEACVEQGPIEGFAIEGEEDGTGGDAAREEMEHGVFFAEIAHEILLDLEAACLPPGDADEEGIGAGTAGQAGGFCVKE